MLIGCAVVVFVLILAFAAVRLDKRARATRCPSCGKAFAMRQISREEIPDSDYDTTTYEGLFEMDLKGNVTASDALVVPATAHIYNCVDECRVCGFQKEVQRTQVYRK